MSPSLRPLRDAALAATSVFLLVACGRTDDPDLWSRDWKDAPVTRTELTGYWEGDVSMGGLRMRIEPQRVTLALRCDSDGRKVAQASAPIVLAPRTMVLQDAMAGGDKACGFRFNKGDTFEYGPDAAGGLEIVFAGASVSRLAKRADLAAP